MDANGLNFWMLSQRQDWPLAAAAGAAPAVSALSSGADAVETQLVLRTPLPGALPAFVLIDSEVMAVDGTDSTGLQLSVTRGAQGPAAAVHPPGALVWGSIAVLKSDFAAADTGLAVTQAVAGAIAVGSFLQIGGEVLAVTEAGASGQTFTVTRGAFSTAAAYPAGTAIFAPGAANLYYCAKTRSLQLLSARLGNPPAENFDTAASLVEAVPMARDAFGNYARWDAASGQVFAGGSGPGEVAIYSAPAGQAVTDLAMGYDGILYIAVGGSLALVDRQDRWPDYTLVVPEFTFWRLCAAAGGGVLALDRAASQLGKVTGAPLQTGPVDTPAPGILRSCQQNPNPPSLVSTYLLPKQETFVAIAEAGAQFCLLSWDASSPPNAAYVRLYDPGTGLGVRLTLSGTRGPYSLAWLGDWKLAVLATGLNEALIFDLGQTGNVLVPAGDTYVLAGLNSGPFAHGPGLPPYYTAGVSLGPPQPLNAGAVSLPVSTLAAGTHAIVASYSGDSANAPNTSRVLVESVAAAAAPVGLISSANPAVAGAAVTFTATVTPASAAGSVEFLDGAASLGTAPVSGGIAPFTIATLAAGAHAITATFSGQTSNALIQTVTPSASNVSIAASPNPAIAGQTVVLTAQVSPASASGSIQFMEGAQLLPLLPVSLNSLAGFGSTDPRSPKLLDSGESQTTWHRLFVEAVMPPRCSAVVWLTASDQRSAITSATAAWYPHAFGDADMSALPPETPRAAWLSIPCEVPYAQPMLSGTPSPDRQGLFMVLVQRVGLAVRSLKGRFLGIRVELHGDRRGTPQIAALRAWGSRFSYVNNYLPEIYRENKFSPAADAPGPSTRRDFFERFVDIFEAQLTRIEDRIAHSYLLTRPETAPANALDWLGSWVGLSATGYPPGRRRARLQASAKLHRKRGTVEGVTHAIDIATNGLCRRGAVIVVEDFRLRHLFATILGADLDTADDPLLPGYSSSSNSFVGGTLFLGDPRDQAEALALFAAPDSTAEEHAVERFYDSMANRMTVFIHNQVETVDVKLVERIVQYEKPAHVAATVRTASQTFMVGLAALVGVDSYLAGEPPRDPVVVGTSQIGRYSMVTQDPSLDPRLES